MATYQRCDRCNRTSETCGYLRIKNVTLKYTTDSEYDDIFTLDLCQSCREEVKRFMKYKPEIALPTNIEAGNQNPS